MALPRRKRRTRKGLRWKHPIVLSRHEVGPSLRWPLTGAVILSWVRRRPGWDSVFASRLIVASVHAPWGRRRPRGRSKA